MIEILLDTFAPPTIAVTGFSPEFKTLLTLSISFSNKNPNDFLLGKNCAMMVVEACARWAVPNASFT